MLHKVFIGVGHGGSDPGAVSGKFMEDDINLTMALTMADELTRHGIVVQLSRKRDENDPLRDEIREANLFKPDIAIDCHNNAGDGDGAEVWRQTNRYAASSDRLARLIEKEIVAIGQNSRGVKTRLDSNGHDYFGFLREVNCPSAIVEGIFIDNSVDTQIADTIAEQQRFGTAYAKAVLKYFGIVYIEPKNYIYRVQIGAFSEYDNAVKEMERANKAGFNAMIVREEI